MSYGALTIGEVIARAEEQFFVGRASELELFQAWLSAPEPEILNVYGPCGIGKSTLVRAFCRVARAQGRKVTYVDGRRLRDDADGVPPGVDDDNDDPTEQAEVAPLIVFDGLDEVGALTDYLLDDYLPTLPSDTRVVVSGARQLDAAWARHDAWLRLVRSLGVPPLTEVESDEYLAQRGIEDRALRSAIVDATGGHPLALSLAASLAVQRGVRDFEMAPEWQMTIGCLLEHVLSEVNDPIVRDILRRCASAEELDEHVLSSVTGPDDASVAFDQLSRLSFVRPTRRGLKVHENIRRFLISDVQWRRGMEPRPGPTPFINRERGVYRLQALRPADDTQPDAGQRPKRWRSGTEDRDREDNLRLLTRRERELAALLARGRTSNRDIARDLVISDGTANLHVKHMLGKLGFSNRAELAAWLARCDDIFDDARAD
jgi:DNA-binding CsgD family transcriptional regulator/energy-coupling factor transporter ATP-binding protein EcfA2